MDWFCETKINQHNSYNPNGFYFTDCVNKKDDVIGKFMFSLLDV